jgi:hypothetical protein
MEKDHTMSWKARANKRLQVGNDLYRSNYDRIFGAKNGAKESSTGGELVHAEQRPAEHDAAAAGAAVPSRRVDEETDISPREGTAPHDESVLANGISMARAVESVRRTEIKSLIVVLSLFVCISRSGTDDPHTFEWPEHGVGHVAASQSLSFFDLARECAAECEAAHGETCETFCFESREE